MMLSMVVAVSIKLFWGSVPWTRLTNALYIASCLKALLAPLPRRDEIRQSLRAKGSH
jgi:hypothetical protein